MDQMTIDAPLKDPRSFTCRGKTLKLFPETKFEKNKSDYGALRRRGFVWCFVNTRHSYIIIV